MLLLEIVTELDTNTINQKEVIKHDFEKLKLFV